MSRTALLTGTGACDDREPRRLRTPAQDVAARDPATVRGDGSVSAGDVPSGARPLGRAPIAMVGDVAFQPGGRWPAAGGAVRLCGAAGP